MIILLINIFLIIISYCSISPGSKYTLDKDTLNFYRNKRICLVATFNWIILSGCRAWTVGPDTMQYKVGNFDIFSRKPWTELITNLFAKYINGLDNFKDGLSNVDPGYHVLEKLASTIFGYNYQVWLIVIAFMFFVPLYFFVLRYSDNALISYIIFSTLFFSFFAFTGIRQTIATSIVVLIGTKYIKEKKFICFLLLILIAMTIHKSCLCFLPFYFVSKIKINKITLCAFWIAIIISYLFHNEFIKILQSLVGYSAFYATETAHLGTFVYLLLCIAIVVTLFYKKFDLSDDMTRIAINAIFLACIFSSLLLVNESTMRVVQYFSFFLTILVPKIAKIFKYNSRRLFNVVIIAAMIFLMINTHPVYSFFWQ